MEDYYDYLVIGGDAAGLSAVTQIRSLTPSGDEAPSVAVLEKGQIISYGACGLPYAISGAIDDFDKLVHFTPEAFSRKFQCSVFPGQEAVAVRPEEHQVLVRPTDQPDSQPRAIGFGKLMIATGAVPTRLPAVPYQKKGEKPHPEKGRIFELKSVPDGQYIQRQVRGLKMRDVTIAGAGYIGLEMAEALAEMPEVEKITILDLAPRPVIRMPEKLGKQVEKVLKQNEIEFLPNTGLERVEIKEDGSGLVVNGRPTDGLLVAVGIRPATDFLGDSGLRLEKGAVVVDPFGQTSHPDIFSGGDCAQVYHRLLERNTYFPLGSTANKQGRIAGMNMAGTRIPLPGILGTQVFKLFDQVFAVTGLSTEEAREKGYSPVVVGAGRNSRAGYYPGGAKAEAYLVVDENSHRILGGYLSGPPESSAMIDTIAALAQTGSSALEIAWFDAAYAPPVAPVWNALVSAAGKYFLKNRR